MPIREQLRQARHDHVADRRAELHLQCVDGGDQGAASRVRRCATDRDGNLWCGWGITGAVSATPTDIGGGMQAYLPTGSSEEMDGVKIFNARGRPIGFIRLPERCLNLEFGGPKRNRLYMAAKWLGQWLEKPQPALGGRKPSELVDTPTGLEIVLKLLGAIESGAYL